MGRQGPRRYRTLLLLADDERALEASVGCGRAEESERSRRRDLRRTMPVGSALASRLSVLNMASLSWPELARRTWRESVDDDVLGLAAQLCLLLLPSPLSGTSVPSGFGQLLLPFELHRRHRPLPRPVRLAGGSPADSRTNAATGGQRKRRASHGGRRRRAVEQFGGADVRSSAH